MIPATLMYLKQLRRTWKRVLGVTVGVALTSSILSFSRTKGTTFPVLVGYQLIISACVGTLFWVQGPLIKFYSRRLRPIPRWTFRIVSAAVTLNLGVLIGMTILASMGALPWSLLWTIFWESVVPTTVIGVLCFIGFTLYENLQYKAQYETAQARLSSLESRLRPHFLFNTLNSIMALIPEDPDAAERMTERLAALLRYSLDATLQNTVRLEQELKVATDYLEIEKTRFGGRLQYSIDVPPELMSAVVPPFSLQTLVENSVKYGGGEIRVSAHNGDGRVLLRVWDSGDGFPHDAQILAGHGLRNLKDRLDALWGSNAAVEFPTGDAGTMVQVSLPVIQK
ncbi:MAG TPA: histidine kinase [Terriglobia bacterium]|nr:histidine kinase [Terriglobia bacterium]